MLERVCLDFLEACGECGIGFECASVGVEVNCQEYLTLNVNSSPEQKKKGKDLFFRENAEFFLLIGILKFDNSINSFISQWLTSAASLICHKIDLLHSETRDRTPPFTRFYFVICLDYKSERCSFPTTCQTCGKFYTKFNVRT